MKRFNRFIALIMAAVIVLSLHAVAAYASGSNVLTTVPGNGFVTLQWKEAADKNGLDGYYLYKGTSPGGEDASPMFDFPVKALTYKDTLVTNGTTYYYIMKPCYDGGTRLGAASNEVYAMPAAQIAAAAAANNTGIMVLTVGNPHMTVNGQTQEIDPGKGTAPVIHAASGRTFVPIRAIVETMGGTIAWDAAEKKVTIDLRDKTLELWIGKTAARVNGTVKTLEAAPYISTTGRTMLPLRFIIENLGCDVVWNGPEKKITIHYDASGVTPTPNITVIPTPTVTPVPTVVPTPTFTPTPTPTLVPTATPAPTGTPVTDNIPVGDTIVINNQVFESGEYAIKTIGGDSFIFIPHDRFASAFNYPFINQKHPKVSETDGNITITWDYLEEEPVLEVTMRVGSSDAVINGQTVDATAGPYREGSKTMIPVNLFAEVLEMKVEAFGGRDYLQYSEDFPTEKLLGSWSDHDMNVYTGVKDLTTGVISLPQFASSYTFNQDGTYHRGLLSTGGFNDMLILQDGKYKVIGNTIILYDIVQTLYRGKPFQEEYKNKITGEIEYEFIEDYDPEKDAIELGSFWHYRLK